MRHISVQDYFEYPETVRPMELVYGVVREPAMPSYAHQRVATRLLSLLYTHVEQRQSGEVIASIDVVLSEAADLVVQPDIVFVSNARLGIIRDRIWGAPDLTVEILSTATVRHDRKTKVAWYRTFGVRECWLVDVQNQWVEVIDLQSATPARLFLRGDRLGSAVLPDWNLPVEQIFD